MTDPPPFAVRTSCADGEAVVWVCGEVDVSNDEQLRAALAEVAPPGQRLVLDLSETTFMGASGVGIIAETYRQLARDRSALVVRRPTGAVRHILTLTAVDRLVTIEDDTVT